MQLPKQRLRKRRRKMIRAFAETQIMEQLTLSAMAAMSTHKSLDTVEQSMIMLSSPPTLCAALAAVGPQTAQLTTLITKKLQLGV